MSDRGPRADGSADSVDSNGTLEDGAEERSALERADRGLRRVRTEPRLHAVAVVAAVGIGLVLSWLHWAGLIVGGALVALTAATPWRGVAGALGFGVVVLAAFALSLGGSVGAVLEMTPVIYLVVASAFGLPLLGSLIRAIV